MGTVRVAWQLVDEEPAAADRLLADEVAAALGCDRDVVRIGRRCPRCGSTDHGRPVVETDVVDDPPHLSLSRAPGVALVAVSTDHPVGVDVECIDQTWPVGSSNGTLHAQERPRDAAALTTLWVRKESLLKATGDGLHVEPALLRLDDGSVGPRLLEWPDGPAVTTMKDLEIEGYAACVSVLGADSVRVTQRQALSGRGGSVVSRSHASKRPRRS